MEISLIFWDSFVGMDVWGSLSREKGEVLGLKFRHVFQVPKEEEHKPGTFVPFLKDSSIMSPKCSTEKEKGEKTGWKWKSIAL